MLLTRNEVSIQSQLNFNLKSFVSRFSAVSPMIMESIDEGGEKKEVTNQMSFVFRSSSHTWSISICIFSILLTDSFLFSFYCESHRTSLLPLCVNLMFRRRRRKVLSFPFAISCLEAGDLSLSLLPFLS